MSKLHNIKTTQHSPTSLPPVSPKTVAESVANGPPKAEFQTNCKFCDLPIRLRWFKRVCKPMEADSEEFHKCLTWITREFMQTKPNTPKWNKYKKANK